MLPILPILMLALDMAPARVPARFADSERARIVTYWNAPGRYKVGLPTDAPKKGIWQIRLTPEGSLWLWKYQNALGLGKTAPTTDFTLTAQNDDWKQWIQKKVDYDRWKAQQAADAANHALQPLSPSAPAPVAKPAPPEPGTIPASLLNAVGNPPPFAYTVTPLQHTITFEDGETLTYADNVQVSNPRYAYYRFPQGVVSYGTQLKTIPDAELNAIFTLAGFSASDLKVAKAVSKLEGGFESVNTYDTGFVSVGFIQFITFDAGKGSLTTVLQQEKSDQPAEFDRDFRQYGVDVTPDGVLTVIDPGTGAELVGAEAVLKVVDDKRLTAVFQRAGKRSRAFRVAQVKIARVQYWPADDVVKVMLGGQEAQGKVSDVVKSEAGMATLFDRKVNRGNINPFNNLVAQVITKYQLKTIAQASRYEKEIILALKYREAFLNDPMLTQPPDPATLPPVEKAPEKREPQEPKPDPAEEPIEPMLEQMLKEHLPDIQTLLFPTT